MYNIYIAILDHGSSRACAMAACEVAFFMSNLGMYDTLFWTIRCFIVNHMMEF